MFQDVSLSYYLELVPAIVQHSIDVTSMARVDEADNNQERRKQEMLSPSSSVDLAFLTCESDINYVRAMWRCAHFMQVNVCLPLALGVPIAKDNGHKAALVSNLQNVYDTLDQPFNTIEFRSKEPRIWRQMIMVSSNYYSALTMLHITQNPPAGVTLDAHSALKSSHKAMTAFFTLMNANGNCSDLSHESG